MLTWGILLLKSQFALFAVGSHPELWARAIMGLEIFLSTTPADIDMEPTSYPNNPINEPSHRIWFRFKFINSDWNGSWIGCLCFDYNRSLTKSITIDCNGVRSSIMIMKERRARVESWDREYAEAAANVRNISPCWCWKPHTVTGDSTDTALHFMHA